jgi:formyltetrahydrofolate synthetase
MPGARDWFDVFCPAAGISARAFVIRASVETIRELGGDMASTDGTDEWMAGLNVLQGRVTLLDRFGLPPILAIEASRGEFAAADAAVHVLESYGLRAIAVERPLVDDTQAPDVSALAAMVREWIATDIMPHAFIMAGRSAREQTLDIVSNIYGGICEWSSAAQSQMARIERAGASEAPVVVEAEGDWDAWESAHSLYGYASPNAVVTHVEWRAAAGYIKATVRKAG